MNNNTLNGTVLIVEDDQQICANMAELFEMRNFLALTAHNGQDALEIIANTPPDIVICDVKMPVMSGIELLKKVRENDALANLPFLFLTAKIEHQDIREGMDLGADDYLFKPARFEDVYKAAMFRLERSRRIAKQWWPSAGGSKGQDVMKTMEDIEQALSCRELEIFRLIVEEKSTREIADQLFVSKKTVDNHRYNIMQKLHISGTNGLLKYSLKLGAMV